MPDELESGHLDVTPEPAGEVVEVRCPVGPGKLFTKLHLGEETGRVVQPDNLIEFSCGDCRGRISRERGAAVEVFHRYNFLGELVVTITRPRG